MRRIPVSLPFVAVLLPMVILRSAVKAQSPQPPEGAVQASPAAAQPEADASAEPADPARSPDDYEASEQISEDLSVSFPVDI